MYLWKRYKEIILYLFFGVATTLVNIISYYIFSRIFLFDYLLSTIVAWLLSIFFAYITNKLWVFQIRLFNLNHLLKEFGTFALCRLFSGGVDLLIMWLGVDFLKINDLLIKVASNVVVVILNYILSKLIIFKKDVM